MRWQQKRHLLRQRAGGFPLGVDVIAPTLSAPDVDAVTQTTATAHVTTDEGNGTWYGVITNNTTQPTDDQIIAGQDHTGGAAAFAPAGQAVSSVGVKSFDVTTLTGAQEYWFYSIQEDAAGNRSNITDYGPFSTSAATAPGAGTLTWTTNGATGLSPAFTFVLPGNAAEGDVPKLYTQDSDDVTHTLYLTATALSAGDIVTGSITLTGVDPLAEDVWQAHARLDRPVVGLGDISNEVNFTVDVPVAPVLDLTSGATDNTPDFTLTGDLVEGDTVRFQYDTVATFDTPASEITNEINPAEDAANVLSFPTGALADDEWFFRARIERPLYGNSDWSNVETITIDATAPTVSSFNPLDNATDVAIDATLVATFAETVTLGTSGVITLKKTSDNTTVDSWDVATDGGSGAGQVEVLTNTALTLHPTSNRPNNTEVYTIWDAGVVKDAAGNNVAALSTTTTWSFTTVAGGFSDPDDPSNLFTQPKAFDNAAWTKSNCSISADALNGPNGAAEADTFIEASDTAQFHHFIQVVSVATALLTGNLEVYAKAASGSRRLILIIADGAGNNGVQAVFDIDGGQVGVAAAAFGGGFTGGTASITASVNGWYKCELAGVSFDGTSTGGQMSGTFRLDNGTGTGALSQQYNGNGTSGIDLWRAETTAA